MGRRLDPFAVAASMLSFAMLGVYLSIIREQDGEPAIWAVVVLVVGATAAGYGAVVASPHRRVSLLLAGLVLVALGLLAILSIGLPVLAAGALCFVGLARAGHSQTGSTGAS